MSRRSRVVALAILSALAAFIGAMLVAGNAGPVRPELERVAVGEVLDGGSPAERFGSRELRVLGWYAELAGDCVGGDGAAGGVAAWLARDCPLRVLLPDQPTDGVQQADLEAAGLRLAAPTGRPFPSRAEEGGANLRLQPLVFVGRFDDPAAASCPAQLRQRCRDTFVVTDHEGLLR